MKKSMMKEIAAAGITFVLLFLVLQAVFYSENPFVIFRMALGLYWLFFIPGYIVLYIWKEKLDEIERSIAGIAAGIALTSLVSYFLTLIGVPIHTQWIIAPLSIALTGSIIIRFRRPSG